jgi:hypothetical protein
MGGEDDTRIGDSAYLCFAGKETMDKDCWSNVTDETELDEITTFKPGEETYLRGREPEQ